MEMLEFKNYGLEELSNKELRDTEGGVISFIVGFLFGALVVMLAYEISKSIKEEKQMG